MNKKDNNFKTRIGGQALVEAVMMRGVNKAAMAVRTKSGDIIVKEYDLSPSRWYRKVPFIRGFFNFIDQLKDSYKYIMESASLSGMMDEDEPQSPPPETSNEPTKKKSIWDTEVSSKLMGVIMGLGMAAGVAVSVLFFVFLPTWIFSAISKHAANLANFRSLFEGLIKIFLFSCYLALTACMKDIKRTYQYHGAEHKTISAYERGLPLTAENVRSCSRFHPRCGTSFIFLVLVVSILLYSVFPINSELFMTKFGLTSANADFIRVICKIILLPFIVGVTYEVIRFVGRHDNILTRIISAPGLWLQRLTTKEPDDLQIEIAIRALEPVIPNEKGVDAW